MSIVYVGRAVIDAESVVTIAGRKCCSGSLGARICVVTGRAVDDADRLFWVVQAGFAVAGAGSCAFSGMDRLC